MGNWKVQLDVYAERAYNGLDFLFTVMSALKLVFREIVQEVVDRNFGLANSFH